MEKRIYSSYLIEISSRLKKITLIIIIIASAIIIGFAVWTIAPFFTNTTVDEPIPTNFVLDIIMKTEIVDRYIINTINRL
jgi:hypothetical protein